MAYQTEMFPGYEQPRRGYGITRWDDGETFDFECGCGCTVREARYRSHHRWFDADGTGWMDFRCGNCGTEWIVPMPPWKDGVPIGQQGPARRRA